MTRKPTSPAAASKIAHCQHHGQSGREGGTQGRRPARGEPFNLGELVVRPLSDTLAESQAWGANVEVDPLLPL